MAWKEQTSRARIRTLIQKAPQVSVRRFSDDYFPDYQKRRRTYIEEGKQSSPPLFALSQGTAVVVDTVQIYIRMVNYDEIRLSEGRETEASHKRALGFLHLHYSACDRLAEKTSAQRVDFHGARMHAVVLETSGGGITSAALEEALEFVHEFQEVAEQANKLLANSSLPAQFRVGIDVGRCVAINNGSGLEQEPLFLGGAANHAAKLAEGGEPGIYLSDAARQLLSLPQLEQGAFTNRLDEDFVQEVARVRSGILDDVAGRVRNVREAVLAEWQDEIKKKESPDIRVPNFSFHYKEPPLSEIDYADLSPSNSIRMELLSTYADISGYTAYIDSCIATSEIADAVRALFVIRAEFQNVVEKDFGGRKVRFIGDCIHALLAEGGSQSTDSRNTVRLGAECAGALHDSFRICSEELKCIDGLGLNIGLELGTTPVTRLGIRGVRSVRVASSVATTRSEQMQSACAEDNQTRFGPRALANMPAAIADLLSDDGTVADLSYDDVAVSQSSYGNTTAAPAYPRAHTADQYKPPRAHFDTK